MQLNCASLQFTTDHFELSTEMNSSVGSKSSLQEIHLKQAGSCSELAEISRKALGTTQNGAGYNHTSRADETRYNFRQINISQEEVTVFCQEQLLSFPSYCFCRLRFHKTWDTDLRNEKVRKKKPFKIKRVLLPLPLLHISHVSTSWNRLQITSFDSSSYFHYILGKKQKKSQNHLHKYWRPLYRS